MRTRVSEQLRPGVAGVAETAVHATLKFINNARPHDIMLKIDMRNALNSLRRDHILEKNITTAYRPGHSTETALLKVVNDLFLSLNKGNISVLALLDFSSAFDTIDHTILVHRLHTDFGFTDTVLQWFSSYLTDRTQYVSLCNHCSDFPPIHSGVPQGSVLGPMLFTMYIKPLSAIIDSHSIIHHSYADDLQLQMSAPPDRISELLHSMQSCISDVKAWATANMLKLNDSKTELMLVTSKRSKHLHNLPTSITIGNAQIPFKQSVKNLGFTLDCHLTMNAHVSNIARTCYFELRRLAYIRRFLTSTATATLICITYLPTLRQLPSQKILSTSCSLQTLIFTRMPKGHTWIAPFCQSQTCLLISPSGMQHL